MLKEDRSSVILSTFQGSCVIKDCVTEVRALRMLWRACYAPHALRIAVDNLATANADTCIAKLFLTSAKPL